MAARLGLVTAATAPFTASGELDLLAAAAVA